MTTKTKTTKKSKKNNTAEHIASEAAPKAPEATTAVIDAPAADPEPAEAPKKKRAVKTASPKVAKAEKPARAKRIVTEGPAADTPEQGSILALAHDYIDAQKSMTGATRRSYLGDLKVACEHFGETEPIIKLTAKRVLAFFESDRVTKKRNGRPKSPLSINKTRRALRQALAWAASTGLIPTAPIPELAPAK